MPILSVKVDCFKTRCGWCHHEKEVAAGKPRRCALFDNKKLKFVHGKSQRLEECLAAEERAKLSQSIRDALAQCGVV